jgi:hypothetical protein
MRKEISAREVNSKIRDNMPFTFSKLHKHFPDVSRSVIHQILQTG